MAKSAQEYEFEIQVLKDALEERDGERLGDTSMAFKLVYGKESFYAALKAQSLTQYEDGYWRCDSCEQDDSHGRDCAYAEMMLLLGGDDALKTLVTLAHEDAARAERTRERERVRLANRAANGPGTTATMVSFNDALKQHYRNIDSAVFGKHPLLDAAPYLGPRQTVGLGQIGPSRRIITHPEVEKTIFSNAPLVKLT